MNKDVIRKLTKHIPVHQRPGRGGMPSYSYIKGKDVITRLNEAFGWEWSSKVVDTITTDSYVVVLVSITAYGVEHQAFGGAQIHRLTSGPNKGAPVDIQNAYKSAYTNAIKKAAEQFGVGLEVSEDFDIDSLDTGGETGSSTQNTSVENADSHKQNTTAHSARSQSAPVTGEATITTVSEGEVPTPAKEDSVNDLDKFEEMLKSMLPNKAAQIDKSVLDGLSESDLNLLKQYSKLAAKSKQEKKNVDTPKPFDTSNVVEETAPVSFMKGDDGNKLINDFQLGALKGLTKSRQMDEADAIKAALPSSDKTEFAELTRKEARAVIKMLNKLG